MQSLTPCPPWLWPDAQRLLAAANNQRLHHGLLITGIEGIGKLAFSQWLAQALLCEQRTEQGACGQCAACLQQLADAHPDFKLIKPEGANDGIKIDTVRELVSWLQLTAGQSSFRVALMNDANGLNRHAANSLLKTLEEPADNGVLILCATQMGALPATVLSRCQKIPLKMHDRAAAIKWLSEHCDEPERALIESGNRPFEAVRRRDEQVMQAEQLLLKAWTDLFLHKGSVGRIADSLSKLETAHCLASFSSWSVMASKGLARVPFNANQSVARAIADTQSRLSPQHWLSFHERLSDLHRIDSASFKTLAVLEGLFADIRLQVGNG